MSKNHRESRKPRLADWAVRHPDGSTFPVGDATFRRDHDGGYTFTDSKGSPVADFPPGTVLYVMRMDPAPVPEDLSLLDEPLDSRA